MRLLTDQEFEEIKQKVLESYDVTREKMDDPHELALDAIATISAEVCCRLLQEYQKTISSERK